MLFQSINVKQQNINPENTEKTRKTTSLLGKNDVKNEKTLSNQQITLFEKVDAIHQNFFNQQKNSSKTERTFSKKVEEIAQTITEPLQAFSQLLPTESPNEDADKMRSVYKHKRILREKQLEKRLFSQFAKENAKFHYEQTDKSESFRTFYKKFKKEYYQQIVQAVEDARKELAKSKSAVAGDAQLFDYSELRKEQMKIQRRLASYDSDKVLKIGKRNVPASIYAHKKAQALRGCSTLLIRKNVNGRMRLMYRNGCGDRNCPICGHFNAQKTGKNIRDAIKNRLLVTPKEELKRGRLVHMVLTVKNVGIERVGDVKRAWRIIQKQKDREFKTKSNPHSVWQHAKWGYWKFESNRNEERGDYHDHLHVLAWVDGWLASSPSQSKRVIYSHVSELRKVKVKINSATLDYIQRQRVKGRGWWTEMQKSWRQACQQVGLTAYVNGSKAIRGAKTQHVGGVLWFHADQIEEEIGRLGDLLDGATAEISKYVSKSHDLMGIEDDDELLQFMAKMHGKQVISGFGGMSIDPDDPEEPELIEIEEPEEDKAEELVYRFDFKQKKYIEVARFKWSDQVYRRFREDLRDWKMKPEIISGYEFSYRRSIEGEDWNETKDEQILEGVS